MIAASPERRFDRGAALPALDAADALRTPLTSIRSLSEILRDNPHLPRATRERFLGIVIAESERLDRAIDRVLNSPPAQAPARRAS
jgi:signal transduction histidine kinase